MPEQIPILLHHGFMDVINLRVGNRGFYSFKGIDQALTQRGYPILRSRVHPTSSIQHRAEQLKTQILTHLENHPPKTKVLIVAHSMGGLDARYMISHLAMADRIAALLTVSTPHRGASYAEYMLQHMTRIQITRLLKLLHLDFAAVNDLTPESCARFNEKTIDDANIPYFSISAACERGCVPPWSRRAHRIITEHEGPNDGLVSVHSSTYANHLATWPVNHWTLLNKPFGRSGYHNIVDRYTTAIEQIVRRVSDPL